DHHFLAEDLFGEGLLRLRAERLLALWSVDVQEANLVRLLVDQDVDRVAVRDLDDLARKRHRRIVSDSRRDQSQDQAETQPRHGVTSRGSSSDCLDSAPESSKTVPETFPTPYP